MPFDFMKAAAEDARDDERERWEKVVGDLVEALEPLERIRRINRTLNPPAETPLRDLLPGTWPNWAHLEAICAALSAARKAMEKR